MAFGTNVGLDFSFLTNADHTSNQYKFVTLNSSGYVVLSGAGARSIGVLQDTTDGSSTVKSCEVRYGGPTKVFCGGSFVIGDKLSADASGKAVKYTAASVFTGTPYTVSGTQVLGIALEAGASSRIVGMLFSPSGLSA